MHDHELCTWTDTFLEYLLVPLVAVVVFFLIVNPTCQGFLRNHMEEGLWLYIFGAVILFFAVFVAGLWRIRKKDCINRGTLRHHS